LSARQLCRTVVSFGGAAVSAMQFTCAYDLQMLTYLVAQDIAAL
jgi:hypothetical protein